jgi:hypothetical protein
MFSRSHSTCHEVLCLGLSMRFSSAIRAKTPRGLVNVIDRAMTNRERYERQVAIMLSELAIPSRKRPSFSQATRLA